MIYDRQKPGIGMKSIAIRDDEEGWLYFITLFHDGRFWITRQKDNKQKVNRSITIKLDVETAEAIANALLAYVTKEQL